MSFERNGQIYKKLDPARVILLFLGTIYLYDKAWAY